MSARLLNLLDFWASGGERGATCAPAGSRKSTASDLTFRPPAISSQKGCSLRWLRWMAPGCWSSRSTKSRTKKSISHSGVIRGVFRSGYYYRESYCSPWLPLSGSGGPLAAGPYLRIFGGDYDPGGHEASSCSSFGDCGVAYHGNKGRVGPVLR